MNDILTITEHQVIYVSKFRDISQKTISYEDRELLFDIVFTDNFENKKYVFENFGSNKIKATSIVGSISLKNGLIIEILPKFAKVNLNDVTIKKYRNTLINMIRVSNVKSYIVAENQNSKKSSDDMPLINYIIELFSNELLEVLRTGLYSTYEKRIENTNNLKGNLLITKTIQNNLIDKSNIYISYNKHTVDNHLMKVFKSLVYLLINDDNLSYNARQNFYEIFSMLDTVSIINLSESDFKNITFNRLNDKFEILFKQAEFIFKQYMPFITAINSSPFWSILFDMDFLFEKFLSFLFNRSNLNVIEQAQISVYKNYNHTVSIKPDFIINQNNSSCVVDAKWKLIDDRKTLYGLNSHNFWQLHSYMNLIDDEKEINGYFIVPKNSEHIDEFITFNNINNAKKNINIITIDFSLEFKDIINNYKFHFTDNQLQINYEIPIVHEESRIFTKAFTKNNIINNFDKIVLLGLNSAIIFRIDSNYFIFEKEIYYLNDNFKTSLNTFIIEYLIQSNFKTLFFSSKEFVSEIQISFLLRGDFNFTVISSNGYFNIIDKKILNRRDFYFCLDFYESNKIEYSQFFKTNAKLDSLIDEFFVKKDKQVILNKIKNLKKRIKDNIKENQKLEIKKQENYIPISKTLISTILNSEDFNILKNIVDQNIKRDDVLIIIFYRNYADYHLKIDIQDYLIKVANVKLVKYLFERKIHDLVDSFMKTIRDIDTKKIDWLYGFAITNSNYLYKIKEIIASYTTSKDLLNILFLNKNEMKILNGICKNFNANSELLDKISDIAIAKNNSHIAHTILKRRDLQYRSFVNILKHFNMSSLFNIAKDITYLDEKCNEFLKNEFTEPEIKAANYDEYSYDEKLDFVIEAKFDRYKNDLIKRFCYEEDIDILTELVADKHNTLKTRFLLLIYVQNFKNRAFKNEELFHAISQKKHQQLSYIIDLSEKNGVREVVEYIENNYNKIDEEILFGYAMSNIQEVHSIRSKICELSLDLEIIDELSKIQNDEALLRKIIMKARYNDEFKEVIKGYNTIYSSVILDRISKYSEYYDKNNEYCLIYLLAKDFNTSIYTKRFIFEQYALNNDDKLLAKNIYSNISKSHNKDLQELASEIYEFIGELNNDFYAHIDIKSREIF